MSQNNVERIIGRLATDTAVRRGFAANPREWLRRMLENGMELNPCELEALESLDPKAIARFSRAIDVRLLKADLRLGGTRD